MVKRFVIIFFLLTSSVLAKSDCKYYAEADVVNDKLINYTIDFSYAFNKINDIR